jgi:hypothetical protein
MGHVHHQWLENVTRDIAEDYERLHAAAQEDPQRAGHGGEGTWLRFLQDWLPPAYEVGTRKYIIPEEGDDAFETDLVVFAPAYPKRLREREEILGAGVAAAFSVKLTLDAAAIRDGVERAARLRRSMKVRAGTVRSELLGAFAVGLLAHSHEWKRPQSTPLQNISTACNDLDRENATHPRECLDYLCVADLATWRRVRIPWLSAPPGTTLENEEEPPSCWTAFMMSMAAGEFRDTYLELRGGRFPNMDVDPEQLRALVVEQPGGAAHVTPAPVAVLIANLFARLSYTDPGLRPVAQGLRLTETFGQGLGQPRLWNPAGVFSSHVLDQLASRTLDWSDPDWRSSY